MAVEAVSSKRHRKKLRRAHRAREARIRAGHRGGPRLYAAIIEAFDRAMGEDARRSFIERLQEWAPIEPAGRRCLSFSPEPPVLVILDELSDIPSSVFQPSLLQRPEPE